MSQFTVHRNRNSKSATDIPYLLDVQSDLLKDLNTRVVIPLYHDPALKLKPIKKLTPIIQVAGVECIVMTPQLAGIPLKELGEPVASIENQRDEIIAALDLLITGF